MAVLAMSLHLYYWVRFPMASFGPIPPKGPRKLAYSHLVQKAPQKCHFESYNGSDHDAMQKRRLASRVFGFTRHHKPYTNLSLTQPPRDCAAYASDEERHNTDAAGHLKEQQRLNRIKEAAIVDRLGAEREYQRQKVRNKCEEDWQKDQDRVEFFKEQPHARVRANKGGSAYDIFTLEYHNSFGGEQLRYEDDCQKWRANLRKQYLGRRASGAKNYNILNWQKLEPFGEVPVKPRAPEPPAPASPRRRPSPLPPESRRHELSKEETPAACTEAGCDKLEYSDDRPPEEPPVTVRDVLVRETLPWDHLVVEAR
ncbi:hypothetical protein SELMODRAFT_417731 [Selaginella moellendorffii]|uniref:Uncharacterized protein n=2 Tax=Selaginella moellendorffii TaxID=88036 RepID=D8S3F2_SELML|nr:hypothetical protein SELMODRAFT_417731 [Selaginella moellendorffii]